MDKEEFLKRQVALNWSNQRMAQAVRRSLQTVSNWRCGRQKIPAYVGVILDAAAIAAIKENREKKVAA
jgi:hypothetical protein